MTTDPVTKVSSHLCICTKCGPPWRYTAPEPAEDASPLERLSFRSWMALCPTCGNKRCPSAADHCNPCSGSNEPGQAGSNYPVDPWASDKGSLGVNDV
jgi:hypothetical protein